MVTGNRTVSLTNTSTSLPKAKKAKPRKSRESFGKLRTLPSGRIQASYVGPDGKRHNAPLTYDNKTDARAWLAKQRVSIHEGTWDPTSVGLVEGKKKARGIRLGDFAEKYISERVNRRGEFLTPRVRNEYARLLRGPLAELAPEPLAAITAEAVRSWNASQLKTGKKTQTARAYEFLKAVMNTAVGDGLLSSNPCTIRGAQSARTGKKVIPPTIEELDVIVENLPAPYDLLVLVAAWGGFRFGELIELRRKDVSMDRNDQGELALVTVHVTRAAVQIPGEGFIIGRPKSVYGIRDVVMPPFLNERIEKYLSETVGADPESLLFPARNSNSTLNQSTVTKQFYRARAIAGRDDMPFHALRHFASTAYGKTGATDKEIMERMGQNSLPIVMRYQHTTGREAELAARLSADK